MISTALHVWVWDAFSGGTIYVVARQTSVIRKLCQ